MLLQAIHTSAFISRILVEIGVVYILQWCPDQGAKVRIHHATCYAVARQTSTTTAKIKNYKILLVSTQTVRRCAVNNIINVLLVEQTGDVDIRGVQAVDERFHLHISQRHIHATFAAASQRHSHQTSAVSSLAHHEPALSLSPPARQQLTHALTRSLTRCPCSSVDSVLAAECLCDSARLAECVTCTGHVTPIPVLLAVLIIITRSNLRRGSVTRIFYGNMYGLGRESTKMLMQYWI